MSVASHDLFNMKLRTCIDTGIALYIKMAILIVAVVLMAIVFLFFLGVILSSAFK